MRKELEDYLFERIRSAGEVGATPRDIIEIMLHEKMINSPKQAWATLKKWSKKGLYDYGISLDLGWKVERFIMGKGISIDVQIELLENQLSGLKKQKKEEMKRCLFSNIENGIIDAKKRNIEIKAIYVGDETFMMLEIVYLNNCPIAPLFCKSPIDFMGYKVYRNSKLDRKEIQFAF